MKDPVCSVCGSPPSHPTMGARSPDDRRRMPMLQPGTAPGTFVMRCCRAHPVPAVERAAFAARPRPEPKRQAETLTAFSDDELR